jgi:hypothetical protein
MGVPPWSNWEDLQVDASRILYEDRWGEVIDRPAADLVELRWFDTTKEMTAEQFQDWLSLYADHVEGCHRYGALVDSTVFLMDRANLSPVWRDANIIPRYNAAGVRKFAYLMPPGMPAIELPPKTEPPGEFPTGYFGRRQDALDWLGR